MNRIVPAAVAFTSGLTLAGAAHAAAFDFFESQITCPSQGAFSGCTLDPLPVVEFIVPTATSSGSASWEQLFPPDRFPPRHTGGDFILETRGGTISSQNLTGFGSLLSYSLDWNVVDNVLQSIFLQYDTARGEEVILNVLGGQISADFMLAGCVMTSCQVRGEWVDPPYPWPFDVPEPKWFGFALLAATLAWRAMRERKN